MPSNRIYPNNSDAYTRRLWDMVYDLQDKLTAHENNIAGLQAQIPTPAQISKIVRSNGPSPLDVTALTGRLMTNQYAFVPKFTPSLPTYKDPSASVGDGTLITLASAGNTGGAGVLYRWNEPFDVGAFQAQQAVGVSLIGTHADRLALFPASSYEPGTTFYETDRKVFYIIEFVLGSNVWVYAAGVMHDNLATIPTDLALPDIGFLFGPADQPGHLLIWGGLFFLFGPGDAGSKYIVAAPGNPPDTNNLWGFCDGSTYACLNGDGTLTNITTPDMTGNVFIEGGAYTGVQKPAIRATWDPSAVTDLESTHVHPITLFNSNLGPVNQTPPTNPFFGVAGGTLLSDPGTPHAHALTDPLSILNPPSESNGGLPLRINLNWYIRR